MTPVGFQPEEGLHCPPALGRTCAVASYWPAQPWGAGAVASGRCEAPAVCRGLQDLRGLLPCHMVPLKGDLERMEDTELSRVSKGGTVNPMCFHHMKERPRSTALASKEKHHRGVKAQMN